MHLPAPPPIPPSSHVFVLAPPATGQAAPPASPPVRRRRIPLPPLAPPPFKYRLKFGALFPSDADTRRDTGETHLRVELDAFPRRVPQGRLRGATLYVTLGYSEDTQKKARGLRIGSASISQLITLPGRKLDPQGRREPGRFGFGGGYGLYLLSVSGEQSGERTTTNAQFGTDVFAEYYLGRSAFVQAKYHTLFGGVKGYFGSGPSLLIGGRY
ncbi:MAG: hypothetical protein H7Z41_07415 [Cytophagales bacterium]|nr:hypothetical protein [Armatimonadota bacterium]